MMSPNSSSSVGIVDGMGFETQVVLISLCQVTLSEEMLPPQVPQPKVNVMGMPFVQAPLLAKHWGWFTMTRLVLVLRARVMI